MSAYSLGGLERRWRESSSPTLRACARDLAAQLAVLEANVVRNYHSRRDVEHQMHLFGCSVRHEEQIRWAVRFETESRR